MADQFTTSKNFGTDKYLDENGAPLDKAQVQAEQPEPDAPGEPDGEPRRG